MESPVHFQVEYTDRLSSGLAIVKVLFGQIYVLLPHLFCLFFFGIAVSIVLFIAWWAILFTGKFPKRMFDFVLRFYRWYLRVIIYFPLFMTDQYPPFTGIKNVPGYTAMEFDIDYPEKLNRGTLLLKTFFGWIYVMIPHVFVLYFLLILSYIMVFISFWTVLFKGHYRQIWQDEITKIISWSLRVQAYSGLFMTDSYPPFSLG